jgi:hypothetical protein
VLRGDIDRCPELECAATWVDSAREAGTSSRHPALPGGSPVLRDHDGRMLPVSGGVADTGARPRGLAVVERQGKTLRPWVEPAELVIPGPCRATRSNKVARSARLVDQSRGRLRPRA